MSKLMRRGRRLSVAMFGVVAALAALTCGNATKFHLLQTGSANVATDAPVTELTFAGLDAVNLNGHESLRSQGLHVADLHVVRPYAATVSVTSPATTQDLSFLGKLEVVLTAPGLGEVVIASGEGFSPGSNAVGLEVQNHEMLPHVRSKAWAAKLRATGAAVAPQAMALQLSLVLEATVSQPKGACN